MSSLRGEEVKLRIDSFEDDPDLCRQIRNHFELFQDFMHREQLFSFVHAREYF